jgi:glycosyltransferase involved in cell wall biosynthesis
MRSLDRTGGRLLARSSGIVLAHDRDTADRACAELGLAPERVTVVPHGSYVGAYPRGRPRAAVREELGVPAGAFVFLCFGQLRADKRIDLLLDGFTSLQSRDVRLVVAGSVFHVPSRRRVEDAARADPRILPLLESVAHERVAELFDAADAFVLARSEVWTSGSVILSLSLGAPVVAARVPLHEDLLGGEEAGWLFERGDADSLRSALERAAGDPAAARAKRDAALERANRLPSWDSIAERTATLLVGGRDARPFR